jgi:hypothetical protein
MHLEKVGFASGWLVRQLEKENFIEQFANVYLTL